MELTKWAFLLAKEMPSGGGSSFYDFVPYHYGPFSFALYRELDGLIRDGYVSENKGSKTWDRVEDVASGTADLSESLKADAARVVDRFAEKPADDLVDYVYDEFPWYTVNSRLRRLSSRPEGQIAVHTVGYEKWSVDRLMDELLRVGIKRLIDVRSNPVARRFGFHKSTLSRIAAKLAIEYVHMPELGIPSEQRRDLTSDQDYRELFSDYVREILPSERNAVAKAADMIKETPSALMCMEANPAYCHRTYLASAVSKITGLAVQDIRGPRCALISS
jgi:uncharacterized protein (DUF488 family)